MKIQVDGEDIYEIKPWQEDVLMWQMFEHEILSDMKRRARWAWEHKCEQAFYRFKEYWLKELEKDPTVEDVPLDPEKFTKFVTSREGYEARHLPKF